MKVIVTVVGVLQTIPKRLAKELKDFEIKGKVEIIKTPAKIGQNTEKGPGDLWRFAVSQTHVRNCQLKLMLKNGSPNPDQKTRPYNNQLKKQNLQNSPLCSPG